MGNATNIKIGDSVIARDGLMCPDMEFLSIAGWQGRVSDIFDEEDDEVLIEIKWDSITLRSLPEYYIRQSEEEGLAWARMNLWVDDVELTQPRDTEKDVRLVIDELNKIHFWDFLGEEGVRVGKILKGIDPSDDHACMEAWSKYLEKALVFPFNVRITDSDNGPLRIGDLLLVHGIAIVDDIYGIIVDGRFGGSKYAYPLCNLEVLDKKSPNYQNIKDYAA